MRAIKIRSGGQAFIMDPGETCPAGEICFFPGEWELAQRMARAVAADPTNTFWKDLLEKKRNLPGYTLFSEVAPGKTVEQSEIDFAPKPRPREMPREKPADLDSDRAKGLEIAKQIIADLEERRKKRETGNVAG